MASSTSTRLKLELMANGENDSTWGTKTNSNLEIMEAAIAGTTAVATTGGTTVLTDVDYTDDEAKRMILDVTGTLVANATIEIPNRSKTYKIFNRTTGSFDVDVKTNAGSAVTITQASAVEVWCDGSNTVRFIGPITDFTTGAPNTASGAAASAVSVTPSGNLTSTNAQAALEELQTDVDGINADLLANYQPLDGDLTTIAGLTATKGNLIAGTGSWGSLGIGSDGFALVADSASAAGMKWAALVEAGTDMVFYQASAPTGWTSVAQNDKALRVVSSGGTGGTAGGLTAFSTVFDARTMTADQIPTHDHGGGTLNFTTTDPGTHTHTETRRPTGQRGSSGLSTAINGTDSNPTGGAGAHTHSVASWSGATTTAGSGNPIDFDVQYCDVILASKDAY